MPRAFLKTKNRGGQKTYSCSVCGEAIKPGERYYTWKFNYGGRYFQHGFHGHPKRSQLSHSLLGPVWDAVDSFDVSGCESPEDIQASLGDVAAIANDVAQEYVASADGIESRFTAGNPTSEACRATSAELESWASDLESWSPSDDEPDRDGSASDEEWQEQREAWLESCREEATEKVNEAPEYQG